MGIKDRALGKGLIQNRHLFTACTGSIPTVKFIVDDLAGFVRSGGNHLKFCYDAAAVRGVKAMDLVPGCAAGTV